MIEVLSSTQPRALCNHWCNHCGEPIIRGTVYQRMVMVDYGQFHTFKSHTECDDLFNAYAHYHALDESDLVDWYDVLEWNEHR